MYYSKVSGIINEQIDSVLRQWVAGDITEEEMVSYLMAWEKGVVARTFVSALKLFVRQEMVSHGYEGGLEEFQELVGKEVPEFQSILEADGLLNQYFSGIIDSGEFMEKAEQMEPKVLAGIIMGMVEIIERILCRGNTLKKRSAP